MEIEEDKDKEPISWERAVDEYKPEGNQRDELMEEVNIPEAELQAEPMERDDCFAMLKTVGVDVAEIYSPPRVTREAKRHGLNPGEAMDLTVGWDFTLERHRKAAIKYVQTIKPKQKEKSWQKKKTVQLFVTYRNCFSP